ncbi:hypothetical protein TcCL_ESM11509 [Trypanosoma cruzi]|nr:hypothetical protein TcCL_ESM11509 [Trypanosoma cruzi]
MKYASPSIRGNNTAAAAFPFPLLLLLAAAAAVPTLYWVAAWMPLHDEGTAVASCVARTQQWLQERKPYINWHFLSVYKFICSACLYNFYQGYAVYILSLLCWLLMWRHHACFDGFGITICSTFSGEYFGCVCKGFVWF